MDRAISLTLTALLVGAFAWRRRGAFLHPLRRMLRARGTPPALAQLLILGDSRAKGWDVTALLPHVAAANLGGCGLTTAEVLARFAAAPPLPSLRVVVVLCGVNDFDVGRKLGVAFDEIRARTIENLRAITAEAHRRRLALVLCTVPSVHVACGAERYERTPAVEVAALNHELRALSATSVEIVDVAAALHDARGELRRDLAPDGLHFDRRGYAVLHDCVRPAIARAFTATPPIPGAAVRVAAAAAPTAASSRG